MIGYVVVPGIDGSDDAHWQSRWEQGWGERAVRIEPASWSVPDLDDWVAAVDRAVDVLAPRVDGIVLVAHSLGCWAVAEWLAATVRRPLGALLVAPPDPSGAAFRSVVTAGFLEVRARPLPCATVLVGGSDDPYCDVQVAREIGRQWGSEFEVIAAGGHLNSVSGLGDWPRGKESLARLIER
jgi:predicted alpha/beta hydrolase family esterase